MAIPFVNYLTDNAQGYGPGDLLGSLIKGYQAQRMPFQMRQGEDRQAELIRQLMLQNQSTGIKNQFLPEQLRQEEQRRAIDLQFQQPFLASDLEARLLKNQIQQATGMSAAQADVALREAQAQEALARSKFAHLAHMTPTQRELLDAYGAKNENYLNALKASLGDYGRPVNEQGEPMPIPRGAVSLIGLPVNERGRYQEEMRQGKDRGNAAQRSEFLIDNMVDIAKKNPKLMQGLNFILAEQQGTKRFDRFIKSLNQEEQTQLDLLNKYSSQLALELSETGNTRSTNQYRSMVQQAKIGAGITPEAIIKLGRETKEWNKPYIAYKNAVTPWIGSSYYIPFDYDKFKNQKKTGRDDQDRLIDIRTPDGRLARVPINKVDGFMMRYQGSSIEGGY